ncbi:hypothetical protein [Kosakonia quasisacchari]|uniref:hypothetical protein n=1 Tax=Kosakonia quasisacchari TaxID=2529380 RepID=UPI0039E173E7
MTNRAKQKKGRDYQRKSEPIIQSDNDACCDSGVSNRSLTIPANENRAKHGSLSFAQQLLHDQTRNVTLPESTSQRLPELPFNSQPYTMSFMDIPILYRPGLAAEPLKLQTFFTYGGAQHIVYPPTITQLQSIGTAVYLDDLTKATPEAFADTDWNTYRSLVDKTATWQCLYTLDILKPGMNQASQFAHMVSIKWSETATQRDIAQQPGAQFAHGFFWPTLFCQEK